MLQPGLTQETLSPQHAFVVQFRANTDFTLGQSHGRVEHVLSGRATTFTSFDELAAFMARVVTDLRHTAVQETTHSYVSDGKSR